MKKMGQGSFQAASIVLLGWGGILFILFGGYLGGLELSLLSAAGSVMIGRGVILLASAKLDDTLRSSIALGTGFGFLALCLMRFWAAMAGNATYAPLAVLLPLEAVLLLAAALWFFHLSFGFFDRLLDGYRSLRAAPLWVQIWIWTCLLPVNLASFFVFARTGHPFAAWAAIGFVFVVLTNTALVIHERGISKLTSLPHLIPWVPVQLWAALLIFGAGDSLDAVTLTFAWAYAIVIGISNLFDAYDTWRWFRGERATLGSGSRTD